MKRRIAVVLPALVAVAASIPIALSTTPAAASAACGKTVADKDGSAWNATANGANERSGSSTGCAINGIAYSGHKLDYHCYTVVATTPGRTSGTTARVPTGGSVTTS